ncbi:Kunitz/Bovine pancreatic trypsin inhibitor domain protein, partial [Ancylostoma caninum]
MVIGSRRRMNVRRHAREEQLKRIQEVKLITDGKYFWATNGLSADNESKTKNIKEQQVPDKCLLPIVTGPCKGKNRRYAYNNKTGKCVKFTYGGCGGNGNNFRTKKD